MEERFRTKIRKAQSRFSALWQSYKQSERGSPDVLFRIIQEYEILSGYLYRVRAELPVSDPFRRKTEDYMSFAAQEMISIQKEEKEQSLYRAWITKYRQIWRENLPLFLLTLVLFILSLLVGWQLALQHPDYVTTIAGQGMIEQVLDKNKWFESIQRNPFLDGVGIAVNNIKVSLLCFVAGAIFGIGGLALLTYNGLLFGALMGFCYINQFHEELTQFVVGHGPLELTIIVASTFASFLFGRVFYLRPYRLFRKRLAIAASEAGTVVSGIVPWLVVAAIIEVGISPWPFFSYEVKIIIGIVAALLFWGWTFWPLPSRLKSSGFSHQ